MRKTESTKTRIILTSIIEKLKENILDKNTDKVEKNIKELRKEYNYYKKQR